MPNKKPHNNKKKGKNKKDRNNTSAGPPNTRTNASRHTPSPHLKALQSITNLPAFGNRKTKPQDAMEEPVGGHYETYKTCTTIFTEWMKQRFSTSDNKMTAVNDLRKGADNILEQTVAFVEGENTEILSIVAPTEVLSSLERAINYRELFTSAHFGEGGGDVGHRYMIDVLKYCRSVLSFGRLVAKSALKKRKEEANGADTTTDAEVDAVGGRFNALLNIEDDEEEEDPEDLENVENDIRERNFPVYSGPEVEEEIDIQEALVNGDDRFQATALLHTMDELMELVDQHYGLFKNYMRERGMGQQHESTSVLQLLMECAVAANFFTESVLAAENALATNHPHLSSFYHVLALVFLPELIANVENLIVDKSADPHIGLRFVAEIVECPFHNKGHERVTAIVKRYTKKMKLPYQMVDDEANKIFKVVSLEAQINPEEIQNPFMAQLRAAGIDSHMWLKKIGPYIGGDRSILNTQKIVQMLMDILQDTNTKLVGRPGFWGEHFDESNNPASKIRGGLDEPFGSAIMPELLELCRVAPFQCLPERSHLITVLDLLQKHVKGQRTKQVPLALTFGLHVLLTSVYILQGDGDLARLASYTKQSFNALFDQLDDLSDPDSPPQNNPIFYQNVKLWKQIRNFSRPLVSKLDETRVAVDPVYSENLAMWNPLIGGEFMLYATYMCSIGLGSATVDSLGQLRFTLHLYNALKQRDSSLEEIPLLNDLDRAFAKTKAVWVGGRPEKGSFCKLFWLAWGMSPTAASQMASERVIDDNTFRAGFRDRCTNDLRDLDEIRPEEFSSSYRRLVAQDFADEKGKALYTIRNAPPGETNTRGGLVDTLTRVNATRDAMDDDEANVMPINFTAAGCILLEFVNALSDDMGWSEIVYQIMTSNPQFRSGKTMRGNRMRGFTASDLNFKIQGLAHFWGYMLAHLDKDVSSSSVLFCPDKVAVSMKAFFGKVSKEKYTFHVENKEKPKQRNPLEGSYPYGSTGRTVRDPLQSILHLKYSKKGKHSTRIAIPGKLAPTDAGDVTPYTMPSKLTRGRSGKYRHIASYSLDELLELGWDGSKYTSTRARHAASGHHVPFIPGYDSDSEDEYEPIDVQRGRRAGTIGLSPDQIGLYMLVPNLGGEGQKIVRIKDPKARGR